MSRANNYYCFFVGDYRRDTMQLSFVEDAAYRRLLDFYYMERAALPPEKVALYRITNATTDEERAAVNVIVARYFTANDGRLHNQRADEEIAFTALRSKIQTERVKKRWHPDTTADTENDTGSIPEGIRETVRGKYPPSPSPSPSLTPTPKTPPTPPSAGAVDKSEKAAVKKSKAKGNGKATHYPHIPPFVHDWWVDREFKAGRLKLRHGETYEQVKSCLIAERNEAKSR